LEKTSAGGPPWILIAGALLVAVGAFAMFWPAGTASDAPATAAAEVAAANGQAETEPNLPERPPAPPTPERQTPVPDAGAPLPPLPLVPNMVPRAPEDIRAAYTFAAHRPDVLEYVPCFCGCETAGHSGNADCFVESRNADGTVREWDTHGMACTICIDVARQAMRLHTSGANVQDIRAAIEGEYARFPSQTPTPTPPSE
jgi:anti-sigma factor RsiW